MGGSLGGIFSKDGQGDNGDPSFMQKLVQGTAKGTGQGLGKSMQGQPGAPGAGSVIGAPSATPVDASFFTPTAMPPGTTAARPGQPGPSPFYAQSF